MNSQVTFSICKEMVQAQTMTIAIAMAMMVALVVQSAPSMGMRAAYEVAEAEGETR